MRLKREKEGDLEKKKKRKMAGISGRNLMPETFDFRGTTADIAGQVGLIWELIRAPLIAPLLRVSVYICLAMSLMLFCERLYMGIVIILVKIFWKKPKKRYNWEPIRDDLESNNASYPMVLVQIPMFNEKEVSISQFLTHLTFLAFWDLVKINSLFLFFSSYRSTRSPLELLVTFHGRQIVS